MSLAPVLGIVGGSLALMLVRPRKIAESWWVCGGATLLVATGQLAARDALHAVAGGLDVYTFLAGMMLLAELARESGVFDWLAALAIQRAGTSRRLFVLVYAVGVVVTTFLSNDATAVVLTPAILVAAKKAKVDPLPHLFVCALVANAASFVLPISNPANLVVFHGAMPSLASWLRSFALPSVASIAITFFLLRAVFRRRLEQAIRVEIEEPPLSRRGRRALVGLGITSLGLVAASAAHLELGLPTLGCAIALALVTRQPLRKLAKGISKRTLFLVAGLFVFVEAVEKIGALDATRAGLARLDALPLPLATLAAALGVGVTNNVVNNLPLGLLTGATLGASHPRPEMTRALLLGVDVGPNLATTGSLATILWLIALRREGIHVGFREFLKVGAIVMPPALIGATLAALL